MKRTYAAPTVTLHGDVVGATLGGKTNQAESGVSQGPNAGSSLSFGL